MDELIENGHFTRQEIFSQPAAWIEALKVITENRRDLIGIKPCKHYDQIIYTGCGSTYYLSLAAASITQELTGQPVRALPASELWLSPKSSYTSRPTLLVAVSRSGETTETLYACEDFLNDRRGSLVTFTCNGEMPLAKMGAWNIVLPSGQEQSIAQTRAFTTLFIGTIAAACLWADRANLFDSLARLPDPCARILEKYAEFGAELGRDPATDRVYWLGSGARYGLASELSLKMKEMSLTHSEPFRFLEFRHGPKSMITPSSLTIGLCSTINGRKETAMLDDIKTLGGRTVDIAESGATVEFSAGLEEIIQNVLYLPFGQVVALERALSKGLNPDRPTNLDAVVKLS